MTAARYIVIRCDGPDKGPDACDAEVGTPFEARTANEVRKHNKSWHRTKWGDICPACWAKGYRG